MPSSEQVYSGRVNLALAKALDADVLLVGAVPTATWSRWPRRWPSPRAPTAPASTSGSSGAWSTSVPDVAERRRWPACRPALRRRGIQLVGAVPYRAELERPRVRDLRDALGLRVLNRGRRPAAGARTCIVAAQAVPGAAAAAARGPPGRRPGRPARGDPQRLPRGHERRPARRPGAHRRRRARPAGLGPVPAGRGETGLPVLIDATTTPTRRPAALHDLDPEIPADDAERARLVMRHRRGRRSTSGGCGHRADPEPPAPPEPGRVPPPAHLDGAAANRRIVLPEGAEPRTLRAAVECQERGIARCVLLARPEEVARHRPPASGSCCPTASRSSTRPGGRPSRRRAGAGRAGTRA